jgi:hypothetical protein
MFRPKKDEVEDLEYSLHSEELPDLYRSQDSEI